MNNKIRREVQDQLNSLDLNTAEQYANFLIGKKAIIIYDKLYKIVTVTGIGAITRFDDTDYAINKEIFIERDRKVDDLTILLVVEDERKKSYSYERVDLAFQHDFILAKMYISDDAQTAKIISITKNTFELEFWEEHIKKNYRVEDYESGLSIYESEGDPVTSYEAIDKNKIFGDTLYHITDISTTTNLPATTTNTQQQPPLSNENSYMVEFSDGEVIYVERYEFCVPGDKVSTSYGDGKITSFQGTGFDNLLPSYPSNTVFLERDENVAFHCYANEVIDLIQDQLQPPPPQNQPQAICKSLTFRYELMQKAGTHIDAGSHINNLLGIVFNSNIMPSYLHLLNTTTEDINPITNENEYLFVVPPSNELKELDEKMLKYFILKVKNNPEYFDYDGYEIYYYDKFKPMFDIVLDNKVGALMDGNKTKKLIYSTGYNQISILVANADKGYSRYKFELIGNRLKTISQYSNTFSHMEALSELQEGVVYTEKALESLYNLMDIFVRLVEP